MTRTRTSGIRIDRYGRRIIDKEHRGVAIYRRLGATSQEHAERKLADEMARVNSGFQRQANPRSRFADCAARYLAESTNKRSVDTTAWHVRLLTSYIGSLEVRQIHDGTLERFVAERVASGVTATTINRSLEVVRTILNRAARSYRDDRGCPLLETMPPLITMLPETPRPPYPITWDEQDRLFSKLPARLVRMVLFAVNTGLRESNVCGLEWAWEVAVPEVGRSVFVIPPEAFKSKRDVVILNDIAWSIVQAQRGRDPIWVFHYRGQRVRTMNNRLAARATRSGTASRALIRVRGLAACVAPPGGPAEDREVPCGCCPPLDGRFRRAPLPRGRPPAAE
ncbi:MAG: site-specific integrase [Betaproteobacteria bacterium]|nr:site-specific integrase [Betaproteobacteria bacterium]